MTKKALSIVIPCYNEEANLKRGVLDEVNDYLSKQDFEWEVIISNDGSTDNSLKLVNDFVKSHHGFSVISIDHGGKPAVVWAGIQKAKHPYVLFTDMDQSTPLCELEKFLPYFDRGYDVVIGSRGLQREGNSLLRRIGGPVFLFIRRLVILPKIIDTQCGFKAFKTSVAKEIFPHLQFFKDKSEIKGWRVSAFDVELLFIAQKWGYKLKEIVVNWKNEDISNTKGDDEARYRKESINMIKEIIRVLKNNFKGIYDKNH